MKFREELIQLADQLDQKGLTKEAAIIDNFLKEAAVAEVEAGMDQMLMKLLEQYAPDVLMEKIKEKVRNIISKKPE